MENEKIFEINDEALEAVNGGASIFDDREVSVKYWVPYTIKSGDTLSGLAQKTNVTVKTIQKKNNIADPNKIKIGDVISIPKVY